MKLEGYVGKSLLIHQTISPPKFSAILQCLSDMYDLCSNFYVTAILYKIMIKYQCIEKSRGEQCILPLPSTTN